MIALLSYLFLALFVSFLCSIMESVLLSTPYPFLMVKAEDGQKWAKTFLKLKDNIDAPLSAILSLNTVAHTIGAAGVGAQAIKVFGEASFGIVSVVLTILILVFTEIIPKTAGAQYWRSFAHPTVGVIKVMMFITYPLVVASSFLAKLISKKESEHTTSREEIAAMANIGADEGVFTDREHKMIQNLLQLNNVKCKEIMTPRVVIASASEDLHLKEILDNKKVFKYSRIPIFSEEDENITGYVLRQTVFEKLAEDCFDLRLKDLRRDIIIVPSDTVLFSIWERMLKSKEHIALLVDEYGGVDGIVTLEDIIETLLGLEILDEKDSVADMQIYAREKWKARIAKQSFKTKKK